MSIFEDFVKTELPQRAVVQLNEPEESVLVRRGIIPKAYVSVELAEGQVLGRSGGVIIGMSMSAVGGDKHYAHEEVIPSVQWNITHGLNTYPAVQVVDSAGTIVEGDVKYNDVNNVTLNFSAAFAGKAYFN